MEVTLEMKKEEQLPFLDLPLKRKQAKYCQPIKPCHSE